MNILTLAPLDHWNMVSLASLESNTYICTHWYLSRLNKCPHYLPKTNQQRLNYKVEGDIFNESC